MEQEAPYSNKWYPRLTVFFGFLFALFWSLDPFFFWIFLGLTIYPAFLWFYFSPTRIAWSERRSAARQAGNFRPYTQPAGNVQDQSTDVVHKVRRMVRIVLFFFGAIFIFFFIVGIFSDDPVEKNTDDTAESSSAQTEQKDPVSLLTDKGNASYANQQYDSALYYYRKALTIEPENKYNQYNIALVFSSLKEYRKSNSLVRKCVQIDPNYDDAWWLLGWNYNEMGRYDSAFFNLDKAYAHEFKHPDFLALMGEVAMKKSNRFRALEAYKSCLAQDSTRVEAYQALAELDPDRASWYLKKVKEFQ